MITKSIKDKIKEHYLENPDAMMRYRQIEKKLKLPLPSVIRYVGELGKEGIIRKVVVGGAIFFQADNRSDRYILEKKIYNLRKIHFSGIIDKIARACIPRAIVLFGSYAKGENTLESDIDIYVETDNLTNIKTDGNVQIFMHKKISEIKNKELANNIINGITLYGQIEAF